MTELELLDRIIKGDKSAFQELKDLYWPVTLEAVAAQSADAELISNICVDAWQLVQFALKRRSRTSNRAIELARKGSLDRFVKEAAMESLAIHQLKGDLGEQQVNTGLSRLKEKYDGFIKYFLLSKGVDVSEVASKVWEKVQLRKGQYSSSKGSFFAWLFTITHNEYVNWNRVNCPRIEIEIPISLTKEQRTDMEREIGRELAAGRDVQVSIELSVPTELEAQQTAQDLVNRLGRGISTRSRPQWKGSKVVVDLVWDEIPKLPPEPPVISRDEFDELELKYFAYNQALKQLCRNEINVFVPRRLVYGFVVLLCYTPREVEKELMDKLLSDLVERFEQECTGEMGSREIPNCFDNYSAHFATAGNGPRCQRSCQRW